ncbi:MAG: GNAT family N-acetyltransferase [Rhodospirillales bacterium]|nr:GNAT family N-acetyltransferase [Rhodospirillales bacterium]
MLAVGAVGCFSLLVFKSSAMSLTFRKAVPSECGDAERTLRMAFTPYVRRLGREMTAGAYAFLSASIERGDVYLAVDGSEIVGVAATERRDGGIYIDRLGVDPVSQGTGLGSFLLERIEEVARSMGLKGMSLETAEMAEGNIRLYRRHGFEIVSRGPP